MCCGTESHHGGSAAAVDIHFGRRFDKEEGSPNWRSTWRSTKEAQGVEDTSPR